MSLVVDPFFTTRQREALLTSVRTSVEVVQCDNGTVRLNVVVDEDPFRLFGTPGEIVFSALTTSDALFGSRTHFNLEVTHYESPWEESHEG